MDVQTQRRDQGVPLDQWRDSFDLKWLKTRYMVTGFLYGEAVSSSGSMQSRGEFITATIGTGANAAKEKGGVGVTLNHSRLVVDSRTDLGKQQLQLMVAGDAYGDPTRLSPHLRVRSVFAQMDNVLFGGSLLVGKAWSSVADLEAFPEVLDPEGPNSYWGLRRSLVRWSRSVGPNMMLFLSAEKPDKHVIQQAVSQQGRPDLVAAVAWDRDPVRLYASVISTELVGDAGNVRGRAAGWGVNASTKVGLQVGRNTDYVVLSGGYGHGTGSNFQDNPPDAVLVGDGGTWRLLPIVSYGGFVGYQHFWSKEFNSTVSHGTLISDPLPSQPSSSLRRTEYTTLNLVWQATRKLSVGVEGQWGYRKDLDGASGHASRLQFTTRLQF